MPSDAGVLFAVLWQTHLTRNASGNVTPLVVLLTVQHDLDLQSAISVLHESSQHQS